MTHICTIGWKVIKVTVVTSKEQNSGFKQLKVNYWGKIDHKGC